MHMKRYIILISAILALSVAGGGAWLLLKPEEETATPSTVAVTRGDVEETVIASGIVEASRIVTVGARVSGLIEDLAVSLGDRVEEGDLIASIEASDQKNDVLAAQAGLDQLNAEIKGQQAQIVSLQAEAKRQEGLRERGINAEADLQVAEADLEAAEATLESLHAQLTQAQIELETAQTAEDRTRITSTAAGTVVAVVSEQGTTVNANSETPTIVKIADLDTVRVVADVSEADIVNVQVGDAARVVFSGIPDETFDAELDFIAPAPSSIEDDDEIDSDEAIYYQAWLTLPNEDGKLRIGMTAEVTIVLDSAQDALRIPVAALGPTDGTHAGVMIWDEAAQRIEPRQVTTGVTGGNFIEIVDGLSEGEKVVTTTATAEPPAQSSGSRPQGGPGGPPPGGMGF